MVRIRLARVGRKNDPHFRIVVQDGRTDTVGRHIEIVGSLSPRQSKQSLNKERLTYWLGKGAQPTDSVHNLLVTEGLIKGAKRNVYHPGVSATKNTQAPETAPEAGQEKTPQSEASTDETASAPTGDTPSATVAKEAPSEPMSPTTTATV